MDVIHIMIAIVIPFIVLLLIYLLGKKSRRVSGREPFVSGHSFPVGRIPYNPMWLFYISYFILWDVIVLFILFTAFEASLEVIASLLILIITMAVYPVRLRRVISK